MTIKSCDTPPVVLCGLKKLPGIVNTVGDCFEHIAQQLSCFGARTIALRPDAEQRNSLPEPWKTSGLILWPMLHGYPAAAWKNETKWRRIEPRERRAYA